MHLLPRIDHIEQCASHPVNVIFWSDGTMGEFPSLPKVNASKNAMVNKGVTLQNFQMGRQRAAMIT